MSSSHAQIEVHQNEYLPDGGTVVDAVLTVTMEALGGARGAPARPGGASAAEIIIIDCSGSMAGAKLAAARQAARAAIDTIRDGVRFAIVAGNSQARTVYPTSGAAVPAAERTRAEAKKKVDRLNASTLTAMHVWLDHTLRLFDRTGAEINHAILLTDGQNTGTEEELDEVLRRCAGRFVCDSRGVGDGWRAQELLKISDALLGTADGIKAPAELAADFRAMTAAAMGKTMANVALRLWTPVDTRIRFLKQVFPEIVDLTDRRTDVSARIGDYPTGSWGSESRDFHLSVEVPPNAVGEEMLAARVSLLHGDTVLGQGLVRALWTDELAYSSKIDHRVAQYSGQAELARVIQEGLAARASGDLDTATDRLGQAVRLAQASGREDTARVLASVVTVDEETGTVRLLNRKDNAEVDVDAEIAAVGSRKTIRVLPS